MLYSNVLVPLGQAGLSALKMLGHGLSVTGGFLRRHVVAPALEAAWYLLKTLGSGSWAALKALGNVLANGAQFVYTYALLPLGSGAAFLARGAMHGARSVAYVICGAALLAYSNVLVPAAGALAAGAQTAYVYVIAPSAAAAAAIASMIAHGALSSMNAVHVHILVPGGQVIRVAAHTTGEAARACGRTGLEALQATRAALSVRA